MAADGREELGVHRFGTFELDESLFELRRNGQPVSIEPRVFNTLRYLIRARDRVVSKHELFEQLWPGQFVSDAALTYCIKMARKAVGDSGSQQDIIRNLHGRGYRFVADVHLAAFAARRSSGNGQALALAAGKRTGFVGREAEMAQLRKCLSTSFAGQGQLALVGGEAGIGKTRIIDELAAEARERGARVLIGRCYEGAGAPAFWPWRRFFAPCSRTTGRRGCRSLASWRTTSPGSCRKSRS